LGLFFSQNLPVDVKIMGENIVKYFPAFFRDMKINRTKLYGPGPGGNIGRTLLFFSGLFWPY
jgi:hypothetical protein